MAFRFLIICLQMILYYHNINTFKWVSSLLNHILYVVVDNIILPNIEMLLQFQEDRPRMDLCQQNVHQIVQLIQYVGPKTKIAAFRLPFNIL